MPLVRIYYCVTCGQRYNQHDDTTHRFSQPIIRTHEDAGQECIESESMLPPHPNVCVECGHLIHQQPPSSEGRSLG